MTNTELTLSLTPALALRASAILSARGKSPILRAYPVGDRVHVVFGMGGLPMDVEDAVDHLTVLSGCRVVSVV